MGLYKYPVYKARFLERVYEMVDDPSLDSIISWSESNRSFIIWNQEELVRRKCLRGFICRTFPQFLIELKSAGFREIKGSASGPWEFGNRCFVRGRPELLEEMHVKNVWRRVTELCKREEISDRMQNLKI